MRIPLGAADKEQASAANQYLASIDGKVTSVNTGSVTIVSSVLPTGASTASLQTSANTSLNSIDQKLTPSSATITSVSAVSSSVQLLASNVNRRGLMLWNDSGNTAFVAFASAATTATYTIKMASSAIYESNMPPYTGEIAAIWNSASGAMKVTEIKP